MKAAAELLLQIRDFTAMQKNFRNKFPENEETFAMIFLKIRKLAGMGNKKSIKELRSLFFRER